MINEEQAKKLYRLIRKNSDNGANCAYWRYGGLDKILYRWQMKKPETQDLQDRLFMTNQTAEELFETFMEIVGPETLDRWDEEEEDGR